MLIVPFDDDEKEESWCDISLMRWYYVSVGNAEVVLVVNSGRDVRWRIFVEFRKFGFGEFWCFWASFGEFR